MITYSRASQCTGKIRYRTRDLAKAAVKRNEQAIGARLRAYKCPWCSGFHCGNPVHMEAHDLKTDITEDMLYKARRAKVLANAKAERDARLNAQISA